MSQRNNNIDTGGGGIFKLVSIILWIIIDK